MAGKVAVEYVPFRRALSVYSNLYLLLFSASSLLKATRHRITDGQLPSEFSDILSIEALRISQS